MFAMFVEDEHCSREKARRVFCSNGTQAVTAASSEASEASTEVLVAPCVEAVQVMDTWGVFGLVSY